MKPNEATAGGRLLFFAFALLGASLWLAPASSHAAPPTTATALKQIDRARPAIRATRGASYFHHAFFTQQLARGSTATALWKPKGGIEIQIDRPVSQGSSLVRVDKVIGNPVKRALFNLRQKAARAVHEADRRLVLDTGPRAPRRGVSYEQAAQLLGKTQGAALLSGYSKMLEQVARPGNPFGYEPAAGSTANR